MQEAAPIDIRQTADFARWLAILRDIMARTRILARICRLSLGNPKAEVARRGVVKLRINYSPGSRLYFADSG